MGNWLQTSIPLITERGPVSCQRESGNCTVRRTTNGCAPIFDQGFLHLNLWGSLTTYGSLFGPVFPFEKKNLHAFALCYLLGSVPVS